MSDKKNVAEELFDSASAWGNEFNKIGKKLSSFTIEKNKDDISVALTGHCDVKFIKIDGLSDDRIEVLVSLLNEALKEVKEYQETLILQTQLAKITKK